MDRRKELDRRYEELRDALCRRVNWEPSPTLPAHFYAMKVRHRTGDTDAMIAAVCLLDATRDFMDKQTPTMAWPDGRPAEALVFSGKTVEVGGENVKRLFGGQDIPFEALSLAFDAPDSMSFSMRQARLRVMADAWKARVKPAEQVLSAKLAEGGVLYPNGAVIIRWLNEAGYVVTRAKEAD